MLVDSLERGVAGGAAAGLAYGAFVAAVANPLVAHLEHLEHGAGHGHEAAGAVAESTTLAVGVGGGILWGVLLGAAFAVAYFFLEPALPGGDAVRPYVLAGCGFLTVSGVPWLALPPAAPGTEYALGTDARLLLYGGLMIVGALTAALAVAAYRRAAPRGPVAAIAAAAVPLCGVAVLVPALAPTAATGVAVPADLAAAFRGLVVLSQASLWLLVAAGYRWTGRYVGGGTDARRHEDATVPEP